jgi:hypothetical protein
MNLLVICCGWDKNDIGDITNILYITACQDIFIDFFYVALYTTHMPTDKPRILLTVDEDLLERIDDFRFENRINTRSEAMRRLLEEALKKYEKSKK